MANQGELVLCAVGDLAAFRRNPETAFEFVEPILREADVRFGQNERYYSDRTDISSLADTKKTSPGPGFAELTRVKHAEALKQGHFDVLSFASNHTMDLGPQIAMETVDVLRGLGFAVIGVGEDLTEARKPAIIERKGTKFGFLAYASVLRPGAEAGPEKPGVAPMRARTLYEQIDWQPGTPPRILTFPYKEDLEGIVDDIHKLRRQVDVVAVSFHWGIHFQHATIADYQREVGHAVIDAGADIILGHHPHLLKGIEVYKGKPIFYSMGNFAIDIQSEVYQDWKKKGSYFAAAIDLYGWRVDPEWTMYAFPPECRKSILVKCRIEDKRIRKVSFLPVLINQKAQPKVVSRENKNFDELVDYVTDLCSSQGLTTRFTIEGNEVVVPTT